MGEFNDDDRNMLVETHTLVKGMYETVSDHEKRIRFTEKVSWFSIASSTGLASMLAKLGIGSGG